MRHLIRLASFLYPPDWRRRYGREFGALLEDSDPAWHDVFDVLHGAMKMQVSTWTFRNVTIACGLAGLLLAAAWAFSLPNQYVSRAMLRFTPSQIPEDPNPEAYNREIAAQISRVWLEVASRGSLSEIIQRPELDLYRSDRQQKPLEDVIAKMKQDDIRIEILASQPAGKRSSAFVLSFNYPDPVVAQKTTRALAAKMADANYRFARDGASSMSLDLLDPASLPKKPTSPNRAQIVGLGLVIGLLAGVLVVGVRSRPIVGVSAIAGCIIATGASFLVPETYVSHAAFRTSSTQQVSSLLQSVVSDEFLKGVIERLNLYPDLRSKEPLAKVIETMRTRGIRYELMPSGFIISFVYTDRFKTQAVVSGMVRALAAANQSSPSIVLDLLDPASLPETPIAPNRFVFAEAGLAIGLLLGLIASLIRRRRTPSLQPVQV